MTTFALAPPTLNPETSEAPCAPYAPYAPFLSAWASSCPLFPWVPGTAVILGPLGQYLFILTYPNIKQTPKKNIYPIRLATTYNP